MLLEKEPLYFYHLYDNDIEVNNTTGLLTPEFFYSRKKHNEYSIITQRYRNLIVNDWKIYGCLPEELTETMIYNALIKHYDSKYANKGIICYRYLPTSNMGANMKQYLRKCNAVRIDINSGLSKKYIENIDFGYYQNNDKNRALRKHYYEKVTEYEYFYDYNDNDKNSFDLINYIIIFPTYSYLPHYTIESVDII